MEQTGLRRTKDLTLTFHPEKKNKEVNQEAAMGHR